MAQDRQTAWWLQTLTVTALLFFGGTAAPGLVTPADAAKPRPERKPVQPAVSDSPLDAPGWLPGNEWLITGNYAEISNEKGVSLGFLGVPPCDGDSRKLLLFQLVNTSHYKSIDLNGVIAALVAEGPAGEPLLLSNRARWRRADLLVSDQIDSIRVEALARTMNLMFAGPAGTAPLRLERVPLGVGISKERVIATIADRLNAVLRPLTGGNPVNPPQIQNQAGPFPFLGYLNLGRADTLYYAAGAGSEAWTYGGTGGVTSTFGWSSERAAESKP